MKVYVQTALIEGECDKCGKVTKLAEVRNLMTEEVLTTLCVEQCLEEEGWVL